MKNISFLKLFTSALYILLCMQSHAQISNIALENKTIVADSNAAPLLLNVWNRNYFRNNEFFSDLASGYTLAGSQLSTQLSYRPHKHLLLKAGVWLQKEFGYNTTLKATPQLTLALQKNGYSFLIGNIDGPLEHQLIEPLYNYERFISNPLEQGVQFKINKPTLQADTWLQWETMQTINSTFQEQFSVGHTGTWTLHQQNNFSAQLPIQGLIGHKGGQLDNDTTPTQSITNAATGIILTQKLNGFFTHWHSENYIAFYADISPAKRLPFQSGWGLYLNTSLQTQYNVLLSLGYWNAKTYIAPRGGILFQSLATQVGKTGYTDPHRNLFFLRLLYQKELAANLYADVRFEPYYDLNHSLLEYAYSLFLSYKVDFSLQRKNKSIKAE